MNIALYLDVYILYHVLYMFAITNGRVRQLLGNVATVVFVQNISTTKAFVKIGWPKRGRNVLNKASSYTSLQNCFADRGRTVPLRLSWQLLKLSSTLMH